MSQETPTTSHRVRIAAIVAAAAASAALMAPAISGAGDHDHDNDGGGKDTYTIAMWGDMPYNALGRQQYPALLADVNANHVEFSTFDGDLKAGGDGPCTDDLYTTALADFATLDRPMVWVPGDNDWTDCWGRYGPATMPYLDPLGRLALERQLFTSTNQSLGRHKLTLTRESEEGGAYAIYSENVRWKVGPVVYFGLNVQGSNDNFPYHDTDAEGGPSIPVRSDAEIERQRNEERARKAADIHWLEEGFAYARRVHAKGVLIVQQADLNFNNEQHLTNPHDYDAFQDYIDALQKQTEAFDGQVVLVHGDSHYFKLDKPLNRSTGGGVLTNFTRLETFGSRNTHWVKVTVDARNPNLFTFEPRIVPGNEQ